MLGARAREVWSLDDMQEFDGALEELGDLAGEVDVTVRAGHRDGQEDGAPLLEALHETGSGLWSVGESGAGNGAEKVFGGGTEGLAVAVAMAIGAEHEDVAFLLMAEVKESVFDETGSKLDVRLQPLLREFLLHVLKLGSVLGFAGGEGCAGEVFTGQLDAGEDDFGFEFAGDFDGVLEGIFRGGRAVVGDEDLADGISGAGLRRFLDGGR